MTKIVSLDLRCSKSSPQQAVHEIEARVHADQTETLVLSYRLLGQIDQLRIPVAALPRRSDGLWRYTCFEAFLAVRDNPAYFEFNFSPSGEWAVYRFRAYRDGEPEEDAALAPNISVGRASDGLTLTATIRLNRMTLIRPGATLRLGLSAVIEAADGTLSYWALKHQGEKPDFHHSDSFALEFALPSARA